MRLCRFGDDSRLGLVEDTRVRDVSAALDVLPAYRYPLPAVDVLIENLDAVCERARSIAPEAEVHELEGLRLLSPVANPGKIIGAPLNYVKHVDEVKADAGIHHNVAAHTAPIHKMGVFLKARSALAGPGEGIRLRKLDRRNDHEVELAVVIGKPANNVAAGDALEYVAGYTIGLDLTIRGPEERCLRKSPDTYAVVGPWLVTRDEIPDPGNLDLSVSVNGVVRQDSNTRHMTMGVERLIEFASAFYTLYPGDIIMTGTPEGVSPLAPGDRIRASIEGVGAMDVQVHPASTGQIA